MGSCGCWGCPPSRAGTTLPIASQLYWVHWCFAEHRPTGHPWTHSHPFVTPALAGNRARTMPGGVVLYLLPSLNSTYRENNK